MFLPRKEFSMRARWFFVGIVCLSLSGCVDKNPCAEATNSKAAYEFAKEAVSSSLRSPSTAVFPEISNERVFVYQENFTLDAQECSFVVISYVDAQNAFGAVVRSNFRVEALYRHSNKLWFATSVER